MSKALKILLGGVPFGRSNVGDEAILSCIIGMLLQVFPDCRITVSTDKQNETAELLKVSTCPLFGFTPRFKRREMRDIFKAQDLFIWSGATGLSDYPENALYILATAQELQLKTLVFCAGMNDEFNPVKYRLLPGKRKTFLQALESCCFHLINPVQLLENNRERKTREIKTRHAIDIDINQQEL